MNTKNFVLVILSFLVLALSGCSKEQDTSSDSSTKSATSSMAGLPEKVDPALASAGKAVYEQNCIFCHQADAIGKAGFAPSLTNQEFLQVASDKFLMATIRDGRAGTGMPPFSHLGRKDVEAIVSYLRSHATLKNMSAEIDAQPQSQGDERLGRFWFDSICSTCHGRDGDGYAAGGTGTAIGKASFLDKVSDGFIRETINKGRSNTRMIGYEGPEAMANLNAGDVDDIIAYLRTVPSK